MTNKQRERIILELEHWMDVNDFSANQFAEKSKIPSNYLSYMRKGQEYVPVGDKQVPINDKYYRMVAETIGYSFGEPTIWKPQETPQLVQMLSTLEDAKEFGYTNIIIGSTGSGKTYAIDIFIKQAPKDNFKITVGSMDTIVDLLDKMCDALRIPTTHSKSRKINEIIRELKRLKLNGRNPVLIFDEAEYMKQATLCNVKELHDHLNKHCGIVLVGTDQLLTKIEKLKRKNSPGMPQFYRRVKYGIKVLKSIDTSFKEFLKDIPDKQLVRFIQRECENYGELHDVLVPAMREASRMDEPLTEALVRKVLNLPKVA